jgi:flavodoxin/NAD-dependent dihydropyrimidine dehydrogenase PreA subunit
MTKSIVLFQSLSGSTKKIAEAIHRGMSSTGEPCAIAPIDRVNPRDLGDYDLIGLGSLVLAFREPSNVTQFVAAMRGVDGKHAFVFCTHGCLPGNYMASVVPALAQRGLTVIGWKDWFGSSYYALTPKPYFTDGHPDEIDLEEAEEFGQRMVEVSRKISQGQTQLVPTLPTGEAYDAIYWPADLMGTEEARVFETWLASARLTIDMAKCKFPKCRVCVSICPVHAISPPDISRRCAIPCFMCALRCPHGAIGFDWETGQTLHDPIVHVVFEKSLAIMEKQGRFRRLIPDEQIGWGTPVWKLMPFRTFE